MAKPPSKAGTIRFGLGDGMMDAELATSRPWTADSIAHDIFFDDKTSGEQVWHRLGLLQAEAPLHFFEEGNFWLVTGYAEARITLGAPGATLAFEERNDRVSRAWREHNGILRIWDWYAHKEGADYARIRKSAFGFFTPAVAKGYTAFLQQAAREVITDLKHNGGGNVVEEVGYRLTTKVTDYLLGLNADDRPDFRELIAKAMQTFKISLTEQEWREADAASDTMRAFWLERIARRKANPVGDDVIATILRESDLSEHEIVVLAENILLAGSDTTANTSTNGIALLLRNPEQMARAQRDRRLRAVVPDEILRLASPGPTTWRGLVTDLDVNGTILPAGSLVCIVLGAANRDPTVFPSSHDFDLDWYFEERLKDRRAIPFGLGQHMCLGQYIVRNALGALFDELLSEDNRIELDCPAPEMHNIGLRHVDQLRIRISPS